ncbi:MAG: hypothetical protein ACOCQR_02530 [bacterium]
MVSKEQILFEFNQRINLAKDALIRSVLYKMGRKISFVNLYEEGYKNLEEIFFDEGFYGGIKEEADKYIQRYLLDTLSSIVKQHLINEKEETIALLISEGFNENAVSDWDDIEEIMEVYHYMEFLSSELFDLYVRFSTTIITIPLEDLASDKEK